MKREAAFADARKLPSTEIGSLGIHLDRNAHTQCAEVPFSLWMLPLTARLGGWGSGRVAAIIFPPSICHLSDLSLAITHS